MRSWLEGHARFRGDAEAVFDVHADRRWSYAELHDTALAWAGTLHRRGVAPGDRIAVLAHNDAHTLALLFAAAELGAVLLPLNWRLSPEELRWQVAHADPRVVLVDREHEGRLAGDTVSLADGPGDQRHQGPGADLDAPWQLMYTSGSTGRPKGALLTHRQILHNAWNTVLACGLTDTDATLTFTPLFHTGGLNCLTTPLLGRGGRVVLTRGVDAAQALALIPDEGITLLMGVPTIYQILADHPSFADADLSTVRDALCGGAPLPRSLLAQYRDRAIPLRQGFGMTEVGPNCFSTPPHRVAEKIDTVGLPIHGVEARLVDPDGAPRGVDEVGELQLRGPVVCAGYLDDPDATAAAIDADGWFSTGDLLSRDADGFYRVAGRIKEMFISGGENVYPAEVEATIHQHPAVAQVAVIGIPDPRWGEVGHAWVEPRPGATVDTPTLVDFLDGRLARFKIPKGFTIRTALPRTASGKIDKPALARSRDDQGSSSIPKIA